MSVRIDEAELRRYVSLDYTVQLAGALQGPQIAAFESLLEDLWNVYLAIDDSECRASIWITHTSSLGQVDSTPLAARSDLRYHLSQDVGLVILDTGAWHVVDISQFTLDRFVGPNVVYVRDRTGERFVAPAKTVVIPPDPRTGTSRFAVRTFADLTDALEHYRLQSVRTSQCPVLRTVWADPNRLFFIPGPESKMRLSLKNFLENVLRGVEVREEQTIDALHPVDLRVTFNMRNRIALIEIKWLGRSLPNVRHDDSRALEGADQLAGYLDANHDDEPSIITRGYLVVIDGRRWRVGRNATTIRPRHPADWSTRASQPLTCRRATESR